MVTAGASPKCMYIDGRWCEADAKGTLGIINPATEEVLTEVAFGGRAEAHRAIDAAARALPDWMKRTAYERGRILKKTADLIRDRADSIARTMTLEQGKPVAESKAEVLHSADTFEWFAEEGKRAYGQVIPNSAAGKRHLTLKHPVGVVGTIGPWNFPIALQSRKIAPALAAGCTVVSKPASQTPLSLIEVFECLVEAGLPAGVANLVMGPAQEIGDEFGGDRHPGLILAVLPRITVKRQHGRDARRGSPAQRIDHDEQLHQVFIRGHTNGLHDKHVFAAHVVENLNRNLAVLETVALRPPQRHTHVIGNPLRQLRIRVARKNAQFRFACHRSTFLSQLAARLGLEPRL